MPTKNPQLVLASQSPYRRHQLQEAGFEFTTQPSQFDEDQLKKIVADPYKLCAQLAEEKAKAVAESLNAPAPSTTWIIGADQLVKFQGQILGKAGSLDKAVEQLVSMAGKTHELITSVCLLKVSGSNESRQPLQNSGFQSAPDSDLDSPSLINHQEICKIQIKNLARKTFEEYVQLDKSWDCAGSYKFEKNGRSIIENVECADETSIVGLPMQWLADKLKELGF